MSTYTLEQLPGEAIVYTTLSADFRMDRDLEPYAAQITQLLDSLAEPVCYIADIRQVHVNLNDIIAGTNLITRGASAYLRHRNVKAILAVLDSKLLELTAKGLNSSAFGFVSISIHATPEEALAAARAKIATNEG